MKKRQFTSQASSGRVGGGFGAFGGSTFAATSSTLSYVQEPADYSTLSNANVAVAFKNVTKKDSTTKVKALEDLQNVLITSEGEIEDAVAELWVKFYPRLSIDSERRVRQLAHTLNGSLCANCGKRIAKHLPRIAGPWLAGTFDADRQASRAAQDAFKTVFSTPEKALGFRTTFQEPILDFCKDALLNETVQTLSDERSVSKEDAEATYARVVSSTIAVVTNMLEVLPSDEIAKQYHMYEELLAESRVWEFSSHADAGVRRSSHRLVQSCTKKQPDFVQAHLKIASKAYIYKGLVSDQSSSAIEFALTLDVLTSACPTIWTEAYSGKKTALSRFKQCLKHGSHSSTTAYWDAMRDVIRKVPPEVLPKSYEEAADLLLATRDGVSRKEERFNASSAWPTYFTLTDVSTQQLGDEDCESLIEAFAMPPINQFVHPSEDNSRWSITGARAPKLVSSVALVKRLPPLLEKKWPHIVDKLIEVARTSQPEQSKDYDKSQMHVAAMGERLSELQRELCFNNYQLPDTLLSSMTSSSITLLRECTALLKARNGKPYGAAAILEEQLRTCGPHLLEVNEYKQNLVDFASNHVPALMCSPSQRHLARILYAVQDDPNFASIFDHALKSVLDAQETDQGKARALKALFPPNIPKSAKEFARSSNLLQSYVVSSTEQAGAFTEESGITDLMKLGVVSPETSGIVLSRLVDSLSLSGPEVHSSLLAFEQLASTEQTAIKTFMMQDKGKELLPAVLRLEDSENFATASKATLLSAQLSSAMGDAAVNAKFGVVLHNLESVSAKSLSIGSVLDLANKIVSETQENIEAANVLPDFDTWQQGLVATIKPPKPSLSLLSTLGGAVHLLSSEESSTTKPQFDAEGLSQALRIAIYVARTVKRPGYLEKWGSKAGHVLALLSICVLVAEDNNSILGANDLWLAESSTLLEFEVMDFISEANAILKQHWERTTPESLSEDSSSIVTALDTIRSEHGRSSPMAYYANLAIAKVYENVFETHGSSNQQSKSSDESLKSIRSGHDDLALSAFIIGHGQPLTGSQTLTRFCNELVADLTDISMETDQVKGLQSLVKLNAVLHSHQEMLDSVQKPRLIFLLKHIIPWLENDTLVTTKAEACKTLAFLVPHIADMYGEHWTLIVKLLAAFWTSGAGVSDGEIVSEEGVLLFHASLKVYAALQRLTKSEEPNDDLVEALKEYRGQIHNGLIELLKMSREAADETHQPLLVTNELLARELLRTPFKPISNVEDLFPLLYAPSNAIQGTAFELLHRQIPAAQEQISFDAALDNKAAQLPDELLSLIIEAPTLESLADQSFDRSMPLPLQGFLYSWRVIFDHFEGSSFRVKSDYIEQLKDGGYLPGLLGLIFDFLGHTRGRPVDASKFNIQQYTAGIEPTPEVDVQWLLSHLYFLALSHMPSLVKNYFLDVRSRQTSQAIESWTAKYISPLLIIANLQSVADWAEKSVKDDSEYENMTVKVGMRSKEINVSFLVDEQTMAIRIVLPDAYPIESAKVVSINRVAVKEEKWQSWLRNCQGVITFSNGSIIDGLTAWRKNVTGALKGQTECAICYSIISGDKQLPTKRCPTCKNLFHSSCLLKWFKTSNASTCPLCRNAFNFN